MCYYRMLAQDNANAPPVLFNAVAAGGPGGGGGGGDDDVMMMIMMIMMLTITIYPSIEGMLLHKMVIMMMFLTMLMFSQTLM